jgi:acetyl esterase/lipase
VTQSRAGQPEDRSVLSRPSPPPDATPSYGPSSDQVVEVWRGAGSPSDRPVLVLLHGGFWRPEWDGAHLRPMAAALATAGWTAASIEYRRRPGVPEVTTSDVGAALRALPRLVAVMQPTTAPPEMVLIGHSAGGHLALWAAAATPPPRLRATLALAPVADLRLAHELGLDGDAVAAFLGCPPDGRADLDPARRTLPAGTVTIVHGASDAVVPPALSRSYASAHPATRLVPVAGAGHFALIDPRSAAWATVERELSRL